jgi:hypothetical protein
VGIAWADPSASRSRSGSRTRCSPSTASPKAIHLEEGSGISRSNRFTARGLAQLLHLFEPHATLLRRGDGALFKTGSFHKRSANDEPRSTMLTKR